MSNIDKQALREAAEKATPGPWRMALTKFNGITHGKFSFTKEDIIASSPEKRNAIFIAAANPATVLALLDELEAAKQDSARWFNAFEKAVSVGARYEERIAELEAREVILPQVQDIHPLGPQSAKVLCEFHRNIVNRCADEIRNAGVKVSINGD
ncbi:ead/Ea22-like family protein [Enterobacter soli]|uniref:Ead/Ea22-like family protein n=1 Tax=Enterobacter soli TaxID=885040 RepID=A0AAW8H246_9ENTR|nr:ead/Ea22-like family protein [Enterobacter soli]MDQ2255070.1 ead/Ea22-like family protein [Enterobacter soli]MDQ2336989.1 ead/Ea22-like family protein [Enterobacter soli]